MKAIRFMATLTLVVLVIFSCSKKENETIKFGATFPLTGEVASYGIKAKQGIELKIEEVNADGGLLGKQVGVDFQDDKNDKKDAVSIVTKFATIDKVPVIFGSAGSTVSLAIAPIANRNKVILISPISSSSKLSTSGGEYFFRTVPSDDIQAEILSNWVYKYGSRNVALVYTNNSWGKPLADGFEAKFKALGGNVLLKDAVEENNTNFRTIITKIKKIKSIDAIVSPTYPKEGGTFVRQLKQLGLKTTLFGGDNWGSPEFLTIAGNAAEGVYFTAPSESTSPLYKKFAEDYKTKFGNEPDIFGAYSYDAATAIVKAIDASQSFEPEKIRQSLLQLDFTGVSGKIKFKTNGDLLSEAFEMKIIKNGKPVKIEE